MSELLNEVANIGVEARPCGVLFGGEQVVAVRERPQKIPVVVVESVDAQPGFERQHLESFVRQPRTIVVSPGVEQTVALDADPGGPRRSEQVGAPHVQRDAARSKRAAIPRQQPKRARRGVTSLKHFAAAVVVARLVGDVERERVARLDQRLEGVVFDHHPLGVHRGHRRASVAVGVSRQHLFEPGCCLESGDHHAHVLGAPLVVGQHVATPGAGLFDDTELGVAELDALSAVPEAGAHPAAGANQRAPVLGRWRAVPDVP